MLLQRRDLDASIVPTESSLGRVIGFTYAAHSQKRRQAAALQKNGGGASKDEVLAQSDGGVWGVGAPAFMRGKERLSAPDDALACVMRFSAGHLKCPGLKPLFRPKAFPLD